MSDLFLTLDYIAERGKEKCRLTEPTTSQRVARSSFRAPLIIV